MVELGGGIVDQRPYVKRGVSGLLNMLRQLGAVGGPVVPPPRQTVVHAIKTIRPTMAGLMESHAPPLGETITRGQLLARVVSPLYIRDA